MSRGLFITFEGIDGCGKSTQLAEVARRLRDLQVPIVVTREPGGTPISEKIREILISPENGEMCDECELLLYLAARAQHVREKIEPALQQGATVLCDRFQDATVAYQGFGRGLSLDFLSSVNSFATGGLEPDLTFIFDISVELSRSRLKAVNKGQDRLESNPPAVFEKIRKGYLQLASLNPQRIVLLDGSSPIAELADTVLGRIQQSLHGSREALQS